MSYTPSLPLRRDPPRPMVSVVEAETAVSREIGANRGSLAALKTSNPDNRSPVRWWLRCAGVSGEVVKTLPAADLLAAWNDTSDTPLNNLRHISAAAAIDSTAEEAPTLPADEMLKRTRAVSAMSGTPTVAELATQLAEALAAQTPEAAPLDEDAVRAIIADEVAKLDRPQALTVTVDGTSRTLPRGERHPRLPVLLTLAANAHLPGALAPYLVGPAGSGKTTACEQVAEALGRPFYTLGALTGAHELMGYLDAAGTYHATPFRQAFQHGGVFLLDEADRSDPSALIALNSALANGFAGFPDAVDPIRKHADFLCIVAANTYGSGSDRLYVGANQLDGASLDRFAMLDWPYDETLERRLTGLDVWAAFVQAVRQVVTEQKVRHIVSPRASMAGAVYLRAGLDFETVANMVVWKGMAQDVRVRIMDALPRDVVAAARSFDAQQVAA